MHHKTDILIARSVGILFVATGFILGIHGLDNPESVWLPTALGFLVTGMIAQGYALVRSVRSSTRNPQDENNP